VSGGTVDLLGNTVGGTVSTAPGYYGAGEIPSTGVYDSNAGDTGYSGFGSLVSAITANITAANTYFVTYFNLTDGAEAANNSVGADAKVLSYNGNYPYTASPATPGNFNLTALANGQYSFWAYEWLYPSPSAGTAANSVINTLIGSGNGGTGSGWTASIPLSSVNVYRLQDGGLIQH
jgi:hypothetical protein